MKRPHDRCNQPIALRVSDDLDLACRLIQACEPRLALSASLAADVLLELAGVDEIEPPSQNDSVNDTLTLDALTLLEQAELLHQSSGLDGAGQTVAVIDSGVAWDHVTLGEGFGPGYRVVGGWDFAENDSDPYDDGPAGYHGTHVASLLAGQSEYQTGLAPAADLVALRVFDDFGGSQLEWIESALQWIHNNQDTFESPITTVNLSVGAALNDANRDVAMSMIEDELAMLREDNILVFAAAGNFYQQPDLAGGDAVLYPASSPSVVPISATGNDGTLVDFAQRQDGILTAPGHAIEGAVPDHVFGWDGKVDDLATLDGTSMASPQAAGASMLIRQAMIQDGLQPTADDVLARLRELSQTDSDAVSGLIYQTIDLSSLIDSNEAVNSDGTSEGSLITGFDGTNESESAVLDLRDNVRLKVGDQTYSVSAATADSVVVIDAHGGNDELVIEGTEAMEQLTLRAGSSETSLLVSQHIRIELRGFENIVFHGGGGNDQATLFDSHGDDRLTSHPGKASLSGVGFQFDVEDVNTIYVHGTAGGKDTAFLHDSDNDDSLAIRPEFTSLRSQDTFQLAFDFETVYATASGLGNDSIEINDSVGDDTLSISANQTVIAGPGYLVTAIGFDSTTAGARLGGDDVARIYADAGDGIWEQQPDRVQWTGSEGEIRIARGFERTEAFEDFQPVNWQTLSARGSMVDDPIDFDPDEEADAARAVFDGLADEDL